MAKHQCAQRVIGTIVENDTSSFSEFVKRCALTVTKSLEFDDVAGPSRIQRSSPLCDRRNIQNENETEGAAAAAPAADVIQLDNDGTYTGSNGNNEQGANDRNITDTEGMQRARKGPRKTRWDVQTRDDRSETVIQSSSNMSEATRKQCLDAQSKDTSTESTMRLSSHDDVKEKSKIKKAKQNEINNNEEDFILIEDTDDASDETDLDLPTSNGAKRKRKTKHANIRCSSPEPSLNAGAKATLASPFFVMNYKPRSPRLQGNILTQGYAVQQCEKRSSPVEVLAGGSQPVQSKTKGIGQSRYMLRANNDDTSSANDQDNGFDNIAKRFLQEDVTGGGNLMSRQGGSVSFFYL